MHVYGYGIGDLVKAVDEAREAEINQMVESLSRRIRCCQRTAPWRRSSCTPCAEGARIEVGMRNFLEAGNFKAFTTTFEDLYGLAQLPGLAVQRLMRDGYGFGAEGDWKTSALVRAMKVMCAGLQGGVSFMEDYTYHFSASGDKVLGAHMLEICELIAANKPRLDILPLSIGGKADPVRLIFDANTGPAILRIHDGYGPALPHGRQRGRCRPNQRTAAEITGGACPVAAASQSDHGSSGMDLCRRRAPYQLQLCGHCRAHARFR